MHLVPNVGDGADERSEHRWRAVRTAVVAWAVSRAVVAVAWALTRTGPFDDLAVGGLRADSPLLFRDGAWYRDLVDLGYRGMAEDAQRFFPLYHLLAGWLGRLLGSTELGLAVVANASALVAFWALYRLVVSIGFSVRVAARSVWWLALLPSAAVLTWSYSEALAIALGVLLMWAVIERAWWAAVPLGVAAGLSRSVGLVVSIAVLVAVADRWAAGRGGPEESRPVSSPRDLIGGGAAAAAPLVGFAAYMLWLRSTFGDWDAPIEAQRGFRAGWRDPLTRLGQGVLDVVGGSADDLFNVSFALGAIVVLAVGIRRVPRWASAYVAVTLVVSLSANNIDSLGRYVLASFPIAFLVAVDEELLVERLRSSGHETAARALPIVASCASALLMAVFCLWAWSGRMIP